MLYICVMDNKNENEKLKTLLYKVLKNEVLMIRDRQHFRRTDFDIVRTTSSFISIESFKPIIKYDSLEKQEKIVEQTLNKLGFIVNNKYDKMFDEFTIHFNDDMNNPLCLRIEHKDSEPTVSYNNKLLFYIFGSKTTIKTSYRYYLKLGSFYCYLAVEEVENIYNILNKINDSILEKQKENDARIAEDKLKSSEQILEERLKI